MSIDLHTHSTWSDGELTPRELFARALELGLSALCITDHDTVDGQPEALDAAQANGIRTLTGVELSVDHETGSVHLLGYGFDPSYPPMLSTIERLRDSRAERNTRIIARLSELGFTITEAQVLKLAGDGTCGRAHIARVLADSGQVGSVDEAFRVYLGRGKQAYFDRYRLPLKDAIALLHSAGGVAVWAHPGLLGDEVMEYLLERLPLWVDYGLDGLESQYGGHTAAQRDRLQAAAKHHNLLTTGGSDFHGDFKPENVLGLGTAGIPVDDSVFGTILKRLERYQSQGENRQ